MKSIDSPNVSTVEVESEWNFSNEQGSLMHSIHTYPAKFPAFIAQKAFEYAESEGVDVRSVADIFCGCGTVALEAKLHNVDFWGCDINPVATLIARTKSENYTVSVLEECFARIQKIYEETSFGEEEYDKAKPRLKYWYTVTSYLDLLKLKHSILQMQVIEEKYRNAYLCIFSSILKATSRWLTKSIKPQVDPEKRELNVWAIFALQCKKFIRAVEQINSHLLQEKCINVYTGNFLEYEDLPSVDMIISSPPYVTSYEYADLHQLSTLWLEYADDYRELRAGSIGSAYNSEGYQVDFSSLNQIGQTIVHDLLKGNNKVNAKVRAVARYYCDMQRAIKQCAKMVRKNGMLFFVVGDTEYKGVQIRNSEHLIQSLTDEGFSDIKVTKRTISNKLCIPFRDEAGRFSSDKSKRTIYHEEFIISARAQ